MADPDNEGHSGYRIDQVAALTDASLATYKPNVVTLIVGTNDLFQQYQVATAPARLSALVDKILADDPGVTVVLADLPVSTDVNVAAGEPAYNGAIAPLVQAKQAAGKHVQYVDMGALTVADLADTEHPNDVGYQKMADAWNAGIQAAAAAGWIVPPTSLGAPSAASEGAVASGVAGKCLDVNGGNSANGTAVQLWSCNRSTAQAWTSYSDGSLRALGKCLDATAAGTANGTKAELYDCNGTAAQVWQSYKGGLRNLVSGRCLDDPNASTTDGTQLALWDCNAGANQKWTLHPATGPVTAGLAGKCLDDAGNAGANGTKADLWTCNGTAAQQWNLVNGSLRINGKCLDVTTSGTANGTLVQLYDCNGSSAQSWQPGANSSLVNTGSGKCLDDPGSSTTDGIQLDIWTCNAGANQRWTLPSA
ncbi:ricin-type beta-trefoil lectin domain protein [Catenulispora yoronensis]